MTRIKIKIAKSNDFAKSLNLTELDIKRIQDKTKVYLYTNKLNDINYQRDCSSVKLPGQK